MKVIKPYTEIITPINYQGILNHIELMGRVCYKSEDKITEDSAEKFVGGIIKRGHESVIEHYYVTVKFICNRAISHEIVRHRIGSYSQESTRYCNYSNLKFGNEITVIEPFYYMTNDRAFHYQVWYDTCLAAEKAYFKLLNAGSSAQEARDVLPNALKTEIMVTFNLREWRHFFKLRCSLAAHPQMRELSIPLLREFQEAMPIFFEDVSTDI